jgi:hypothetical protein
MTIIPLVVRNRPPIDAVAGQEDCKLCRVKMVARVILPDKEKELSQRGPAETGKSQNA